MTDEQQRVAAFRQAFDAVHAPTPTVVDCDTRTLRIRLLREKLQEIETAMEQEQLIEIAKKLADLLYVVYGITLAPVFREVQRSNMTTVGGTTSADGKWSNPATYSPADIAPILDAQRRGRDHQPAPQSYREHQTALLRDPSTPYWVQRLLPELAQKDPVDVLGALEVLRTLMQRRFHEALRLQSEPPQEPHSMSPRG